MTLLAFGEALVDMLSDGKTPESFTKYPGGAPANVAVAFAKLGGQSYFCGSLGQDFFGDFLAQALIDNDVDTQYCIRTSEAKTGLAFVSLDASGERTFSFYRPPAADLLFKESDFQHSAFENASIFHICSNSLTEEAIYQTTIDGLRRAKDNGCICSFDINLRESLWQDVSVAVDRIWQCITATDVLKLSSEESQFLIEQTPELSSIEQLVNKCLALGVSLIVYTQGERPVEYFTAKYVGCSVIPSIEVVDTTAAGDAFVGGLLLQLANQTNQGLTLNKLIDDQSAINNIISFATACGAFACTQKGAFPSLPTIKDIEQLTSYVEQ